METKSSKEQAIDDFEKSIKRRAEDVDFLVEDWYPKLKEYTPKTIFMEMSESEGKAIVTYYNMCFKYKNDLTFEHTEILQALEKRINDTIKKEFKTSGAFIRLSTRSPKDGISLYSDEILENQENDYYTLKESWKLEDKGLDISKEEIEANLCLASLFKAEQKALRCSKGSDAMSLLLTSERVYNDINTELACAEAGRIKNNPDQRWNIKISLREWNEEIDGFMEFRCFVKNNHFRAISQYNHYIIIGDLLDESVISGVREKILSFWNESIKEKLKYLNDYIIDFALAKEKVFVIELNPYLPNTGPGLFDWKDDEDLLQKGEAFENESLIPVKIRNKAYPNVEGKFENFLKSIKDHVYDEEPYYDLLSQLNADYRTEEEESDENEEKNEDDDN